MPRPSKILLPLELSDRILYAFLIPAKRAASHVHPILLDLMILIMFAEEYKL
jgi:hypothetical protein